jgi:mannosyltransferase
MQHSGTLLPESIGSDARTRAGEAGLTRVLVRIAENARYQYALLAAITVAGIALRLYHLGVWSFWIDEIFTVNRAQAHYHDLPTLLRNIPPFRHQLPLSVILTSGALAAFGVSEWSARIVPALIGIVSIPLIYFPAKRFFGAGVGLIAALLLAVSPWHVYWSQNARFFTSLMLLYTLAVFALYWGLERDRPWLIVTSLVLLFLGMSERYYALFMVPVAAIYLLLLAVLPFGRPAGLRRRNLAILAAPFVGLALLDVYALLTGGSPFVVQVMRDFWGRPIDSPVRILILTIMDLGVPLVVMAVAGAAFLLMQRSRAGLLFAISAFVPVILLMVMNPFMFTVNRYVFLTLPSFVLLAAVAAHALIRRVSGEHGVPGTRVPGAGALGAGVLVLLLADAASAHLMYFQLNDGNRLDWRGAMAYVRERRADGDAVVVTRPQLAEFYLQDTVADWAEFDVEQAQAQGNRVWIVLDSEGVWSGSNAAFNLNWVEQNAHMLTFTYLRVKEQMNLRILLFDPSRPLPAVNVTP